MIRVFALTLRSAIPSDFQKSVAFTSLELLLDTDVVLLVVLKCNDSPEFDRLWILNLRNNQ